MIDTPDPKSVAALRKFSYLSCFIILLISVFVLIGWVFNIALLKSVVLSFITMKANTAIGFILSAIGLLLIINGKEKRFFAFCIFCLLLALGSTSLIEYIFRLDLKIDELFFKDTITKASAHPGRMAFPTALIFSLTSIVFFIFATESSKIKQYIAQSIALVGLIFSLITCIGYFFGTPYLAWVGTYGSLAIHTALAFVFLTAGLLAVRPTEGFMALFVADNIAGMTIRRFLPVVFIVPLALGYLRAWGQKMGFYGTEFGIALQASFAIAIFTTLTWVHAKSLNKIDYERRRLKGVEEYLRQILESAPDAMIVVNKNGEMVLVNSQAEHLFGYDRQDMLKQPIEMLMPQSFRDTHLVHRQGFMNNSRRRNMGIGLDLWGLHKDRSSIPIEIALSPFEGDQGSMVIAAVRDMREHKRHEEAIRQLNKDLQEHAAQLEFANKELEAFSYSVSHDLRSPLRAIDGFARILSEEHSKELTEEGGRLLGVVRDNVKKMGCLIDGLLEFSRMGRHELRFSNIDMTSLVQSAFEELRQSTSDLKVDFKLESLPSAYGDSVLLRQVWVNLISNAMKYSMKKSDPSIHIYSREEAGEIVYVIKDNGVGFDMQYVSKLFKVFQRLHEQSDFEGTGVGLAIVQRIINRHGGNIWVQSQSNEGTTFYFTLPIKRNAA